MLSTLGLANESAVAAAIASGLRLEYVQGQPPDAGDAVAHLLPEAFCRQYRVAPLSFLGATLTIAVTDPLDYSAVQAVEFRTAKRVTPVVVTQTRFETLLSHRYQKPDRPAESGLERLATYDQLLSRDPTGEVEVAVVEQEVNLSALADQPPIVRLVNLILSDAAKAGASDVHIEPHETQLHVRQRVDGLLRDVLIIPRHLQDAAISRLKIMAGMDIAERRKPQDGRARLRFGGRRIDLRVSTMPMQFGEKVVIRLLNAATLLTSTASAPRHPTRASTSCCSIPVRSRRRTRLNRRYSAA